jgi:hypothetical protein
MHGMNNFGEVSAQQARIIYKYKNTKETILKHCNTVQIVSAFTLVL